MIAAAITAMGVATASNATPATMAANIKKIKPPAVTLKGYQYGIQTRTWFPTSLGYTTMRLTCAGIICAGTASDAGEYNGSVTISERSTTVRTVTINLSDYSAYSHIGWGGVTNGWTCELS